jgi:hypothetical protein
LVFALSSRALRLCGFIVHRIGIGIGIGNGIDCDPDARGQSVVRASRAQAG